MHGLKVLGIGLFTSLLSGSALLWGTSMAPEPPSPSIVQATVIESLPDKKEVYTLGFVGDIMLDRGVKWATEKEEEPYYSLLEEIIPTLQSYDVLFGNLEGPMSATGTDQGSIYSFRMDPRNAKVLKEAGFDILSVANNHSFDWGVHAFKDTMRILDESGIAHIGGGNTIEDASTPHISTLPDGTTIAFLGFSEFGKNWMEATSDSAGIAIINTDFIHPAVEILKEQHDIVVISLHFGEEYEELPNETQRELSEGIIDAGADLVVGHHPHVLQPLEKYSDGYIAYSLGNFIFDQNFSLETMTGGILTVDVEDGSIRNAHIRTTFQDSDYKAHILAN